MQSKTLFLLGLCTILSTTASAVPLDAKGAKQQLNQAAKQKVFQGKINLDALVTNESNDLIVEYNIPSESVATGLERRNYIAANKKNIQSRFNRGVGVQVLRDYNNLPIAFYRISNKEALVDLLNDPNVKAVYPNRINQATTMESLPLINQPQANTKGFNGTGSSVAVLDTGVNYLHSDFGCTAVNSPSSTCRVVYAFDSAPDDGSLDDNGHGSNVSAIVSKVATKTKIIGIDVFRSGSAYDSDILAGINWAVNNAKTYNIKAINL
ncbi:S8 family serine peptidase, partial [Acinetobacter nosocomialis]